MSPRRPKGSAPRSTITAYLLNDDVESSVAAISPEAKVKRLKVTVGGQKCDLFAQPAVSHPPRWIKFFGDEIDAQTEHLMASSPAGVLIVPHKERLFAVTFGHGRHLL